MIAPGKVHPERAALAGEVHARPPVAVATPAEVSHLVTLSGEARAAEDHAHMCALCERFGLAPPAADDRQYLGDFGRFRLRWERHTEFSSWTFVRDGRFATPYESPPIQDAPADWLAELPGQVLVSVHLALLAGKQPLDPSLVDELFERPVGGPVAAGAARVWADFRLHGSFGRILVQDLALTEGQRARLVQRLLEIETYRVLALLGLGLARRVTFEVSEVDRRLAEAAARLPELASREVQRALLDEMLALGAEIERIAAATNYRFSAARAYYDLVERRIEELREQRDTESERALQPIGQFLRRRLTPAIRTCESLRERQETLSRRLARASNLLRTRIDLDLAAQNRSLLASMDRRAGLQLRLQRTVEGLSVAAISYYLVGLLLYTLKAAHRAGLPLDPEVTAGAAVPAVVLLVWSLVRRVRKALAPD